MNNDSRWLALGMPGLLSQVLLVLFLLPAGCAVKPSSPSVSVSDVSAIDDSPPLVTPAYYLALSRMSAAEFGRERHAVAVLPKTPSTQLRQAMILGHPRGQQDLPRASVLLDGILKSNDPAAVGLSPLARLLADNYGERQRLEAQLERQGLQMKESQRKVNELQEKLDALADIERTLPTPPRSLKPAGAGNSP